MLTAINSHGEKIIAFCAQRGKEYSCPKCKSPLIFKAGAKVVWHFAHHPDSDCLLSKGESLRHMEMKEQVGKFFKSVDYEITLIPERRADLVIFDKFVVECQESPISIGEWEQRTKDYNRAGFPVLWIWDITRVVASKQLPSFSLLSADDEYRIPLEIRNCHRSTFGRIYALDKLGVLMSCHFDKAMQRDNEWYSEDGEYRSSSYTPKALRYLSFQETPLRPHVISNAGLRLIGLGEKTWWK